MRLRVDDELVFGIDRRHAGVALDDTLIGRHLRTIVVRVMAFAEPAGRATAILRMRREPRPQLLRILGKPRDPVGRLQLLRPLRELGARPTPMRGRVARQLDAVDREHPAPDQALAIAHRQHRRKNFGDVVPQRAHEVGDRREVRRGHAAPCHKHHVLLGRPVRSRGCARCPASTRRAPPSATWPVDTPARRSCRCGSGRRSAPDPLRDRASDSARARTCWAVTGAHGRRSGTADSYRGTCRGPWRVLDRGAKRQHIRNTTNPSRRIQSRFHIDRVRDLSYSLAGQLLHADRPRILLQTLAAMREGSGDASLSSRREGPPAASMMRRAPPIISVPR